MISVLPGRHQGYGLSEQRSGNQEIILACISCKKLIYLIERIPDIFKGDEKSMYSSIIEIKKSVPGEMLAVLRKVAEDAFSNRAGSVKNTSRDPYRLVFCGGEDEFGCLEVGMLELEDEHDFLNQVDSWHWIDEDDPSENCDILQVLAMPVY